jgi:RNA polymerase sigma factor (sigma-70 family)
MNKEKWDLMSNEELCKLYQETRSDELFEYFFKRNENLMFSYIQKYIRKYPEYEDDIRSLATVEMWEAMLVWDEEKNAKFSTIYYFWVLKALAVFYRNLHLIKLPAHHLQTPEEIEKVLCSSLNINVRNCEGREEEELIELVADESALSGDAYVESDPDHVQLNKALSTLDGRTEQCLRWYLGLADGEKHSLEEIGQIYGVTRERIRQIMVKGVKKLRKTIHNYFDIEGWEVDHSKLVHFGVCDAKGEKHVKPRGSK